MLDSTTPQYWLLQGDAIEQMSLLADGSIGAIIVDPPYGTTQAAWDSVIPFSEMWAQVWRVLAPGRAAIVMSAQPFTSALVMSNVQNFKHSWVWDKKMSTGHLNAKRKPMMRTEDVNVFCRGALSVYTPQMEPGKASHGQGRRKAKGSGLYGSESPAPDTPDTGLKYPTNLLAIQKIHPSKTIHPSEKPVELMRYMVRTYSLPGDVILDFAMGSGTTGVAALAEGRHFVGIESDPAHFCTATERLGNA